MKSIDNLTEEEVNQKVKRLEGKGYYFFVDSHSDKETPFYTPDRVKLPDGRILDEKELNKELKSNPDYEILTTASYLFDLCFSEQYGDERFEHFSFDGDEDVENCRNKYGGN